MKRYLYILISTVLLISVIGCDNTPSSVDYQKEIMVFGFLWGNESLDQSHAIQISYSKPINEPYNLDQSMISNAEVTLTETESGQSTQLIESADKPGYYFNSNLMIKAGTSYTLEIQVDNNHITARTKVPSSMTILTEMRSDTVNDVFKKNLGSDVPLYLDLESQNDDRIILVEMYCNEKYNEAEYIYPFSDSHKYPEEPEEYDGGIDGEPRKIQALVPYKDLMSSDYDDNHVIYWYESMIVFYGSYTMQVFAIDDNYHYYLTTENSVYNGGIEGGLGVLGSVVGRDYALNVMKPDDK